MTENLLHIDWPALLADWARPAPGIGGKSARAELAGAIAFIQSAKLLPVAEPVTRRRTKRGKPTFKRLPPAA